MRKGKYEMVSADKSEGRVFTPSNLANYVADQMLLAWPKDNFCGISVLDPAVGDGKLLEAITQSLFRKKASSIFLQGFDIDKEFCEQAKTNLKNKFSFVNSQIINEDFLTHIGHLASQQLSLLVQPTPKFDFVITNPPYVRTQVLGAKRAQALSASFNLSGRVDLYQAFILASLSMLKDNGIAGIIVSNRFMTTKSGYTIRNTLFDQYNIIKVIDFGDTKLFSAAVLPAVVILSKSYSNNKKSIFISAYETKIKPEKKALNVIEAISSSGQYEISPNKFITVKYGVLESSGESRIWKIKTDEYTSFVSSVDKKTWKTFEQIGKIRVGVKTTADKIFIRDDWEKISSTPLELLKPLITHHASRSYKMLQYRKHIKILYPYGVKNGKRFALDITKFPHDYNYLFKYKDKLSAREYLIKSGKEWYEIWVPQNPDLWGMTKIVFRDIAEHPTFWLDDSGAIVNGDCYWMVPYNLEDTELLWLILAVANSSFIEALYDHKFCNKLYAGKRRFISQYVEKFPLPAPDLTSSKELILRAKYIHSHIDTENVKDSIYELDQLVWKAFGLLPKVSW